MGEVAFGFVAAAAAVAESCWLLVLQILILVLLLADAVAPLISHAVVRFNLIIFASTSAFRSNRSGPVLRVPVEGFSILRVLFCFGLRNVPNLTVPTLPPYSARSVAVPAFSRKPTACRTGEINQQ